MAPRDPVEDPFRKPALKLDETDPVVRIAIERALDPILDADELRADPRLVSIPAFTSPQRTNSSVSLGQGLLLQSWIEGNRPPRIVKIAPGEKGDLWDECLAGGFICVGWDDVGDLRKFPDWSSFRKAFRATCELGKVKGHVTNKAQELWVLTRLRPGDKVVANRGISRVLGVGTVKDPGYVWDDTRSEFKHTVLVDWDPSVACEVPPQKHWAVTTVDKVSPAVVALVFLNLPSPQQSLTNPRRSEASRNSMRRWPLPARPTFRHWSVLFRQRTRDSGFLMSSWLTTSSRSKRSVS